MEYIRLLGGNLEYNLRSIHMSRDVEIKIGVAAAAVLLVLMVFWRRKK